MTLPFKVVLLSYSRSGGHMVKSILEGHPNLFVSEELTVRDGLPKEYDKANLDQLLNYRFKGAGNKLKIAYLPIQLGCVGDTMTGNSDWWKLIKYIQSNPNVRIISLRREGYLSRYVSHVIASKTGNFVSDEPTKETIEVDPLALLADAARIDQLYSDRLGLLRENFVLHVTYEKLLANTEEVTNSLFEFVGVNKVEAKAKTTKQERRPISEVVTNYKELQEIFKDRQYLLY